MSKHPFKLTTCLVATALFSGAAFAGDTYGPYPVTVKTYDGDKTNSVSYIYPWACLIFTMLSL